MSIRLPSAKRVKQCRRSAFIGALLACLSLPAAAADECPAALQQLKQAQRTAIASGKASPRQIEQSGIYLRRLEAWWKMEAGNRTLQASCAAIATAGASGYEEEDGAEDAEDAREREEQFRMLMRQFDAAGVPQA